MLLSVPSQRKEINLVMLMHVRSYLIDSATGAADNASYASRAADDDTSFSVTVDA
jgi:hypothetical protein